MMIVNAMQRVLSSPELVSEILQYSENSSCLLVNKLWSHEYMTITWWEVRHASRLFNLLAPLNVGRDGLREFSRSLQPDDWTRFDSYALRVKQLDMYFLKERPFHQSLFDQLHAGRTNVALLPILQSLDCPADLTILRLFARPSVTSLGLHPSENTAGDVASLATVFSSLSRSMPHIRALYINIPLNARFDTESTEFNSTVPLALSKLLRLEELNIPPSWLTSCMTKALASLPALDSIDAIDMWDLVPNGAILPSPADLLVPSDFPCLKELHAPITLRRALSWLQRVSSSRFMIQLSLLSPERESKATYMSILQYVSDNMSSCIELFDLEITKIVDPQKSRATIQLFDLKPIFACQKLQSLELCFPFPFDISVEEIILIIQSLPSLKELILNPSPSNTLYHKPSIHISCLSTLARSPPSQSLEILGLYVDTSSTQLPSFNEDLSLANLESLDLGYSSLSASSVESVATYIGRIIPKQCTLTTDWGDRGGIVNERWQRVETLLELERRAGK